MLAVQVRTTECAVGVTPVPDSDMLAGEPVALLVTVTVPGALPAVIGLKMMLKASVCPADSPTGVPAPVRL